MQCEVMSGHAVHYSQANQLLTGVQAQQEKAYAAQEQASKQLQQAVTLLEDRLHQQASTAACDAKVRSG